jgi:regulator of RNase E activity RraA
MWLHVFSRAASRMTSIGRYFSVAKQIPVKCAGIVVEPGHYILGDLDCVVAPQEVAEKVVEFLNLYDENASKMIPILRKKNRC